MALKLLRRRCCHVDLQDHSKVTVPLAHLLCKHLRAESNLHRQVTFTVLPTYCHLLQPTFPLLSVTDTHVSTDIEKPPFFSVIIIIIIIKQEHTRSFRNLHQRCRNWDPRPPEASPPSQCEPRRNFINTTQKEKKCDKYYFIQIHTKCGPGQLRRYRHSLWVGRSGDRIPVEVRFSTAVQTGRRPHPSPYTAGTGSLFRR